MAKKKCFNCGNAEHEKEGITCLLHNWYFNNKVARKCSCTDWESEEQ